MPTIHLDSISYSTPGGRLLFDQLHLHLTPGIHGLVGENGAGKSTLLAMIAGQLAPDAGHVGLFADARDDGPPRVLLLSQLEDTSDPLDTGSTQRSPGERQRARLEAALTADADVLLLDEPTNHLDREVVVWLTERLRDYVVGETRASRRREATRCVLLVSHDRSLLDAVCDSILRLRRGQLDHAWGGYTTAKATFDREDAARAEARHKLVREVDAGERHLARARHERASAQASRSARHRMRSTKDADARSMGNQTRADWAEGKASRRVEVTRRALASKRAELDRLPFEVEHGRDDLWLRHDPAPKRTLLRCTTNAVHAGDKPLLGPLALTVERGQHIRIAGPNGAGKTTLLNALAQHHTLPPARVWHSRQDVDPHVEGRDALQTLARLPPDLRGATLARVGALGLDPEHVLTTHTPSPGETLKLRLALAMATQAWLLLLDEPTNHLDLPSIERLQHALKLFPGTLVLITHDDVFAKACTTLTWQLEPSRMTGRPGTLTVMDHES